MTVPLGALKSADVGLAIYKAACVWLVVHVHRET
jgi:hypothetical protein